MSSSAERIECREVPYSCQSASIPGSLLYTAGKLAFVQFETRHWAGYDGFSFYVTAAIFPGHLRFCEERPQGVVNFTQAPVLENTSLHQEKAFSVLRMPGWARIPPR